MRPNLVIIGAMKAGTTSLHHHLSLHPQIWMSRRKELNFFSFKTNWARGISWYESHFPHDAPIRGEASPSYTDHPRTVDVAARMHDVIPDAKLIYMVRDPIARMVSQYIHSCWAGEEQRSFEVAVRDERASYLSHSKYYMQLEQYLPYYPTGRILVVGDADLRRDPFATMQAVFRFLGVDDTFRSDKFTRKLNVSGYKRRKTPFGMRIARAIRALDLESGRVPVLRTTHLELLLCLPFSRRIETPVINDELRRELCERLADDLAQLRRFTGRDFAEWGFAG
jgi:hypothetical protein